MASKKRDGKVPPKAEIDLRNIPLSKIRPNPWNFNEESSATFEALRKNIREDGFLDPIHVVETDDAERPFMILGGEHRFNAVGAEGYEEVPCIVLNREKFKDKDLQVFLSNRLNMRGKVNMTKFAQAFADLRLRYPEEQLQKLLAFTDAVAWKAITKSIGDSVKGVLPGGAGGAAAKRLDKELKGASPGSDIGSIVGRIMSQHGGTLQFGYLVFTYGGQEHHYIPMTEELRDALKCFQAAAEEQRVHVANLLAPILSDAAEELGHGPIDTESK